MSGSALLLELLHIPAARDDQPRARLHPPRSLVDPAQRLGEGCCANPIHLGPEGLAGPNRMHVGIDQTRDDRAALQIDHTRLGARKFSDVNVAANNHNFAIAYRDSLASRELIVDRQNLAVHQNRISALRPRRGSQD